jgi:hypothetical protein
MDPDRPVQEVNAADRFWRAEDVAADDAWVLGPYARASLFSFVLMNVARPVIYASPFPFDILQVVVHAGRRRGVHGERGN